VTDENLNIAITLAKWGGDQDDILPLLTVPMSFIAVVLKRERR